MACTIRVISGIRVQCACLARRAQLHRALGLRIGKRYALYNGALKATLLRIDVIEAGVYTANTPVHIVCTFGGGTAKIYVNGVERASQSGMGTKSGRSPRPSPASSKNLRTLTS